MKHAITVLLTLACVAAAATAGAEGMYAGAGIGNTFFSSDIEDAADQAREIDENATAWKIFGGFTGEGFFGVEGGYRDFGEVSASFGGDSFSSQLTGWDVEGVGHLSIAIVDVFGKAGAMFWSRDVTAFGAIYEKTGTDFCWGLGAGVSFGAIGARLEWESVEVDGPENLSMVTVSATLGF